MTGPTGVGKTELSLQLAERFHSPILSADSRQIYKDMSIGTAAPTQEQLQRVRHYFVGQLGLDDYYSAAAFEAEALALMDKLFRKHEVLLLCGGSMMYLDAVCGLIDEIPSVNPEIRKALWRQYEEKGLDSLLEELQRTDPGHYERVDRKNYKRVIHALEICRTTGRPYSDFRTNSRKERPFRIAKIGLKREREELYTRINRRVDEMMAAGLLEEAQRLYPFRQLNALNTVGYKEIFQYMDGKYTLDEAVEKIKRNTRVYARKQMTWFKRDPQIAWFHPDREKDALLLYADSLLSNTEV